MQDLQLHGLLGGKGSALPDGWNEEVTGRAWENITKADPIMFKKMGLWEDGVNKVNDPSTLPANTGYGCSFSPDGTYLAVAHYTSPYITIYKRSGDTFTKLANPATLPTSTGYGCAFSPDGTYLAIAHGGSPYITIYKSDVYDSIQKITAKNQYFLFSPPEWRFGVAMETKSVGETGKVVLFPKIYNMPNS